MTEGDYVTIWGCHTALQSRMGDSAPAYETLRTQTRSSYLKTHPELAEITPRPRRLTIRHPFYRRMEAVARFARDLMASMRPARTRSAA